MTQNWDTGPNVSIWGHLALQQKNVKEIVFCLRNANFHWARICCKRLSRCWGVEYVKRTASVVWSVWSPWVALTRSFDWSEVWLFIWLLPCPVKVDCWSEGEDEPASSWLWLWSEIAVPLWGCCVVSWPLPDWLCDENWLSMLSLLESKACWSSSLRVWILDDFVSWMFWWTACLVSWTRFVMLLESAAFQLPEFWATIL